MWCGEKKSQIPKLNKDEGRHSKNTAQMMFLMWYVWAGAGKSRTFTFFSSEYSCHSHAKLRGDHLCGWHLGVLFLKGKEAWREVAERLRSWTSTVQQLCSDRAVVSSHLLHPALCCTLYKCATSTNWCSSEVRSCWQSFGDVVRTVAVDFFFLPCMKFTFGFITSKLKCWSWFITHWKQTSLIWVQLHNFKFCPEQFGHTYCLHLT